MGKKTSNKSKKESKPVTVVTTYGKDENHIFCYGTLNIHDIQRSLWGEAKEGRISTLKNYELKMWPGTNIFYVERKVGESVAGKVYTLTKEQLEVTDRYESKAYKRVRISEVGKPVIETYVINKESGSIIGGK